eukprot:13316496-Heterocapsa_arctica.AAC.1
MSPRSSRTGAGTDDGDDVEDAAGLTLVRLECCVAPSCANEQLDPNRHPPVRWKIMHTPAGGGGGEALAGALRGLRFDRRFAT